MVIQRHLTRAHKLRAVKDMIQEDPGIVPELLEILSSAPDGSERLSPTKTKRVNAKTQVEKVLAFLREYPDDELHTIKEIAEGTGLTRNTVSHLLYKSGQRHLFYHIRFPPKKY